MRIAPLEDITLRVDETDFKLFSFSKYLYQKGFKNILILSQDTDVKILAVYWSAVLENIKFIIKHGSFMSPAYFHPSAVLSYYRVKFKLMSNNQVKNQAEALVKVYIMFGSDQNCGFVGIGHGFAMTVYHELAINNKMKTEVDFLELILLTYEQKNAGIKRLFSKDQNSLSERLMSTRRLLKAKNGIENLTIPLESTLRLHCKRTFFLFQLWTDDDFSGDPCENGWEKVQDEYKIQLKSSNDRMHKLPEQMMLGCFCKGECNTCDCSVDKIANCKCRKCKCFKISPEFRGCSVHTCKNCKCFKREKEGELENLLASYQLQKMVDDLSSEEEDDDLDDDFVEQDLDFVNYDNF